MARCGIVVTAFYALVLALLLLPGGFLLAGLRVRLEMYGAWAPSAWIAILVAGEALLLFLSVDGSRRLRERRHLAFTSALVGFLVTALFSAAVFSLWLALKLPGAETVVATLLAWCAALWVLWATLFYLYYRGSPEPVAAAVAWLLKGSVLELLIAVPSHIVVHRRNECTDPMVTSYGVVTGLAIMLLAFGPGVLALYKKRIDGYRARMQRARP